MDGLDRNEKKIYNVDKFQGKGENDMGESAICCFTGHRRIDSHEIDALKSRLERVIDMLVGVGITHFRTGGAIGFDTLAALIVLEKKEKNDKIFLELCLPCRNQSNGWSEQDVSCYEYIKARADKVVCLHESYVRGCMHERNRYMVDGSRVCIAYCNKESGGSYYTVKYAEAIPTVSVINLAK